MRGYRECGCILKRLRHSSSDWHTGVECNRAMSWGCVSVSSTSRSRRLFHAGMDVHTGAGNCSGLSGFCVCDSGVTACVYYCALLRVGSKIVEIG
jgi:hypothetical protein